MYYNPTTQQQKSITELKELFNASIPLSTEEFNGWHNVHIKPQPTITNKQKCVYGSIILEDGTYWQTWQVQNKTPEEIAQETISDYQARIDALESVVRELVGGAE